MTRHSRLDGFACRGESLRALLQGGGFALALAGSVLAAGSAQATPLSLDTIDPAPAGSAPLLQAGQGVTALTGRVLATDARPLAGVRLSAGTLHAMTDAQGRFLLTGVPAGEQVLRLDGRHATAGADQPTDYGFYEVQVSATTGRTTALPWVDWLPRIDHAHEMAVASPVAAPVVVTTPAIAGLELRIPKGAVLTDPDGKLVTHVGITSISTRRPPFPLPRNVDVPVYFTAQPGGTVISSADGTWLGAQVVYPNYHHQLPRARETFWKYEPDSAGWTPYGAGTVTADARQVVPDPLVRIYELDGAMMRGPNPPPPAVCNGTVCPGPPPKDKKQPNDGDPVDLSLGAFTQTHTDFSVSDVLPIGITRSYTSTDTTQYAFGAGMSFAYDIHLYGANEYQTSYLVLPGGYSVYYTRTPASITGSCGVGCWQGAVFTTTTPGAYFNSTITYNGDGWNLVRQDGAVLIFGDNAPLAAIQDRFGNRITLTRAGGSQTGLLTQISSPNGRFIRLAYQNSQNPNVVTSATDNIGRTFTYGYDPTGRMLQTVTNPNGGITTYTWTSNYQIQSIQDPRKNTFITNAYDTNLRVHQQTLAASACLRLPS
jgi:YD repeat-containing protein